MRVTTTVRNPGGNGSSPVEPLLLGVNPKLRGYRLRLLANDGLRLEAEALRHGVPMSALLPRLAEIGAEGRRTAVVAAGSAAGGRVTLRFGNAPSDDLHRELALLPDRLWTPRVMLLAHYGVLMFYALQAVGGYPAKLRDALFGEPDHSKTAGPRPVAPATSEASNAEAAPYPAGAVQVLPSKAPRPSSAQVVGPPLDDDMEIDISLDMVRSAMQEVRV